MRRFINSKLLFNAKSFDSVPGPKPYPILGNANLFFSKPYYKVHEDLKADYGNLVKFKMFGEESVLVSDPEEIQKVFMSNQVGPERTNMEAWMQYRIDNNLSLGVTQVNGEEWKRLRSGFLKLLSPQVVDSYVSRVADIAQGFNQWVEENRENDMVDYTKPTQFYGFEAIMSIVLGKKLRLFEIPYDQVDSSVLKFVDGIRGFLDETDTYMFKDLPWHYLKIKSNCVKRMHKAMDDVFEIAPEMIKNHNIGVSYNDGKKNYIDYVQENENLTENEKTVSLVEMLGAGVDTTSNASQWVLYSLATNPEEQEKIYQQVMEVTKGEIVTSDMLKKLSLVKWAVTEALRVNIVVPTTNRILNEDITLSGYNIPARTVIHLNHAGVSHDEKIWEESASFCPHRHEKKSHPFATFPFGAGSRMCPGKRIAEMELQVLTATILQKYELKYKGPVIENNLGLLINPKWTPETKLTFHKRK